MWQLKEGVSVETFSEAIVRYLCEDKEAQLNRLPIFGGPDRIGALRRRDYWALVLARLKGMRLTIYRHDDNATREKKIESLLEALEEGRQGSQMQEQGGP